MAIDHGSQLDSAPSTLPARPPRYWDLAAAVFLGLALLQLIALSELSPNLTRQLPGIGTALSGLLTALRLVMGLAYVLFIPGYLLQALLFPRHDALDSIERAGMSLGLSIALVPALVLLLDRLPWGVSLWSVVIGQVSLVVVSALLAVWRRSRLPAGEAGPPGLPFGASTWWHDQTESNRRIYSFSVLVLLLLGAAITWVLVFPSDGAYFTEFYLLGPSGLAENYPRQSQVGQPLQVTLGVANHERTLQTYRMEVWAVDPWKNRRQSLAQRQSFALKPGEKLEWEQAWRMPWEGADQQVEFLLYIQSQKEPYRRLSLWLKVDE
jgi:uncharacterized membrane protein